MSVQFGGKKTIIQVQSDRQPKFRRRGSPIPRGGQGPRGKKKLIAGTSGWFQVTVRTVMPAVKQKADLFLCFKYTDTIRPKVR